MSSSELSVVFCYVYVLHSSKNNNFYIGLSLNLRRRLAEHNKGLSFSTQFNRPWRLLYYEAHINELDARRREKYLKTTAGHQALRKMLKEELKNLSQQKVYY